MVYSAVLQYEHNPEIRHDQGTIFVGAKNGLDTSTVFLVGDQFVFYIDAPHSSHAEGMWEQQIKTNCVFTAKSQDMKVWIYWQRSDVFHSNLQTLTLYAGCIHICH